MKIREVQLENGGSLGSLQDVLLKHLQAGFQFLTPFMWEAPPPQRYRVTTRVPLQYKGSSMSSAPTQLQLLAEDFLLPILIFLVHLRLLLFLEVYPLLVLRFQELHPPPLSSCLV